MPDNYILITSVRTALVWSTSRGEHFGYPRIEYLPKRLVQPRIGRRTQRHGDQRHRGVSLRPPTTMTGTVSTADIITWVKVSRPERHAPRVRVTKSPYVQQIRIQPT